MLSDPPQQHALPRITRPRAARRAGRRHARPQPSGTRSAARSNAAPPPRTPGVRRSGTSVRGSRSPSRGWRRRAAGRLLGATARATYEFHQLFQYDADGREMTGCGWKEVDTEVQRWLPAAFESPARRARASPIGAATTGAGCARAVLLCPPRRSTSARAPSSRREQPFYDDADDDGTQFDVLRWPPPLDRAAGPRRRCTRTRRRAPSDSCPTPASGSQVPARTPEGHRRRQAERDEPRPVRRR